MSVDGGSRDGLGGFRAPGWLARCYMALMEVRAGTQVPVDGFTHLFPHIS
jgi:hypothetical protein